MLIDLTSDRVIKDVGNLGSRLLRLDLPLPIRVFGIPRGGSFVAMLLHALFPDRIEAESRSDRANILVDDLVDSGRTRDFWIKHTGLQFEALYEKADPDHWYQFPWEVKADHELGSAEDIPIRLLQFIGEDVKREGLLKTPQRFLKAWQHWSSGYSQDPTEYLSTFEDGAEQCDEMVLLRDIPVWSHCEHHLAPFFGVAHVGYVPDKRILGLSKISRVIDVFAHRLQVQERITNQVANALFDGLQPHGVGVIFECQHTCMSSRGIHQPGIITKTTALRGVFRSDAAARAEFLDGAKK